MILIPYFPALNTSKKAINKYLLIWAECETTWLGMENYHWPIFTLLCPRHISPSKGKSSLEADYNKWMSKEHRESRESKLRKKLASSTQEKVSCSPFWENIKPQVVHSLQFWINPQESLSLLPDTHRTAGVQSNDYIKLRSLWWRRNHALYPKDDFHGLLFACLFLIYFWSSLAF